MSESREIMDALPVEEEGGMILGKGPRRKRVHQGLIDAKFAPQQANKTRMATLQTIVFQRPGIQPVGMDFRATWWLETSERAYQRDVQVSREWVALENGWVVKPGFLSVPNPLPRFAVNPSVEEKQRAEGRVVEIGVVTSDGVVIICPISPGRAYLQEIFPGNIYAVRCPNCAPGETFEIEVTVFPA